MVLQKQEKLLFFFVYHWLARGFDVNLDAKLLTVHLVVKRENLWILMNIVNTNQWKSWITEASRRGGSFDVVVQFIEKPKVAPVFAEAEEQPVAEDECLNEERVEDET
jgi:hypothetical protein